VSQLIIEHVLKLGSLTDAKFFLVVEDADGQRRVMGDTSYVKNYVAGSLRAKDNDLRLDLDPNATSGLFERPVNTIFEEEETTSNKRAANYMENEFNSKRAKIDSDTNGKGTNEVEGYDDECNIYVDKLPASFGEEEFKQQFAQFGQISRIKLLIDKKTSISKCNGFVLYDNSTSADSAINEMNGKVVLEGGNALYVRKAKENKKSMMQFGWPGLAAMASPAMAKAMATSWRPSAMSAMSMPNSMGANPYAGYTAAGSQAVEGVSKHTLFVYNLSTDSSEIDLYSLFGKFGAIVDVHIQRDLQTGGAKGFGFVAFAEYQQAAQAIQSMDGYLYEKNGYKPLQVKFKNRK